MELDKNKHVSIKSRSTELSTPSDLHVIACREVYSDAAYLAAATYHTNPVVNGQEAAATCADQKYGMKARHCFIKLHSESYRVHKRNLNTNKQHLF